MKRKTTWDDELKNLGKETDAAIAERLGVSRQWVHQRRLKLGIPAVMQKVQPRPRVTGDKLADTKSPDEVRSVSLSAEQRQLITDKRLAQGWSQEELANKTGVRVLTIHYLETGKARPSPATLARVCKQLGLGFSVDVSVEIFEVRSRPPRKSRSA